MTFNAVGKVWSSVLYYAETPVMVIQEGIFHMILNIVRRPSPQLSVMTNRNKEYS